MKNKQSLVNILFILITIFTIFGKSMPLNSIGRLVLTGISIVLIIPYIIIVAKDKMYTNRLNLFATILAIFQIFNILYYTYVLKK